MPSQLATNCIERSISALHNLHSVIGTDKYLDILDEIVRVARDDYSRRVFVAGVGKNANIASKISETMASLGIPSFYLNVSHCGHGDFGFVGPADMVIHISRSGQTREMIVAMNHLKEIRPHVYQALIHCKPNKPKSIADCELFIGSVEEGDEFGLAPTTSTTALLCILDCLSVEASNAIDFKRLDFLQFHPDGALGALLKAEVDLHEPPSIDASSPDSGPPMTDISAAVPVEGVPINNPAIAALVDPVEVDEVKAFLGDKE